MSSKDSLILNLKEIKWPQLLNTDIPFYKSVASVKYAETFMSCRESRLHVLFMSPIIFPWAALHETLSTTTQMHLPSQHKIITNFSSI